ncbi:MAG: poly-beta-1,6-N-acetyl-D-glucosamine N-deacetylase PgaB [Pseudomonadales bacterium]|nr:poly-beta-1,6-N-acetyl-D-glucosamine N-deacetylase PgaB [Pseudomonadales bacterium]
MITFFSTLYQLCIGSLIIFVLLSRGAEASPIVLRYPQISSMSQPSASGQGVTPTLLLRQLNELKNSGYSFIRMDALGAKYRSYHRDKVIIVCFDAPSSLFMKEVLPILHVLHIPAVVGVIGHRVRDHDRNFLNGADLKKLATDPLISLAIEGDNLDMPLPGDPQKDRQPAATTRAWLGRKDGYESEKAYRARISDDLQRSQQFFEQQLGLHAHIVVWPGGDFNEVCTRIAASLGMTLGLGYQGLLDAHGRRRFYQHVVDNGVSPWQLEHDMKAEGSAKLHQPVRLMHVNLDYVYDADPVQEASNLQKLLQRIRDSDVNTVYLQAFADPDGNGAADAVYFPNRHLPVRQDLFNHVAWSISKLTQVRHVFAWMPLLAWQLPVRDKAAQDVVVTLPNKPNYVATGYPRLSPFSSSAKVVIRDLYTDLGRHAYFNGILFHDDITLSDFEDDSKFARSAYQSWGLPASVAEIRLHPQWMPMWTLLKTDALDNLALSMAHIVRDDHPGLLTARNLYAQVVLHKKAEEWYAQSLESSLADFDYTAIEAMPYMEQAHYHSGFYRDLFEHVKAYPQGLLKTIFELQAKDWRQGGDPVPSPVLANTVCMLYDWGVLNVGYIPDDPYRNSPDLSVLRPAMDHHCKLASQSDHG